MYIATFFTHFGAQSFYTAMKHQDPAARMMPVPRALSASCGICVSFEADRTAAVIAAHNHPHGFAVPSMQDVEMTDKLAASLNAVGVSLCDHIIFSREDFIRMSRAKKSQRRYYVFQ